MSKTYALVEITGSIVPSTSNKCNITYGGHRYNASITKIFDTILFEDTDCTPVQIPIPPTPRQVIDIREKKHKYRSAPFHQKTSTSLIKITCELTDGRPYAIFPLKDSDHSKIIEFPLSFKLTFGKLSSDECRLINNWTATLRSDSTGAVYMTSSNGISSYDTNGNTVISIINSEDFDDAYIYISSLSSVTSTANLELSFYSAENRLLTLTYIEIIKHTQTFYNKMDNFINKKFNTIYI